MTSTYVAQSAAWSVLGFLFGFGVSQWLTYKAEQEAGRADARAREQRRRIAVGWMLLVLALATVLQGLYFQRKQQQTTQCQARYNAEVSRVIQVRSEIADSDQANLLNLIRVISVAGTPLETRNAVLSFLNKQEALNVERRRNPIPTLRPGECHASD